MKLTQIKQELNQIKRTTFGICIPELRKLARRVAKDNYREFLDTDDYSCFELKLLHAFVIGYAKDDIRTLLDYFKAFVPYVNDWAVNDSLCQNFKIARKYPEFVWNFVMQYQHSDKEFESRIVSVMLLSYYLNDDYVDRVIKVLDGLNTERYYAKMGVAWAIATIMGKYPEKCLNYLKSKHCHLDPQTYRKSLQKIRESYRVSDAIKNKISSMNKR